MICSTFGIRVRHLDSKSYNTIHTSKSYNIDTSFFPRIFEFPTGQNTNYQRTAEMRGITNFIYSADGATAKCNNFGGHKFPSEVTAKNAWIKWLDEPEKRKLGCRWQFHAVELRSSLPHAAGLQFRRLFPMSPAFRAIRGADLFRCEWVPHLSEYVCNIWLRSDGRVERKRGYRHTDSSWHE